MASRPSQRPDDRSANGRGARPGSAGAADGARSVEEIRRLLQAATRRADIVSIVNATQGAREVAERVVEALADALRAQIAFVLVDRSSLASAILASTGIEPGGEELVLSDQLVKSVLGSEQAVGHGPSRLGGEAVSALALAPARSGRGDEVVVGVARSDGDSFGGPDLALVEAVTASMVHALERSWDAEDLDRTLAQQAALARAARVLNDTLERDVVLERLCEEAAGALSADNSAVYLTDAESLVVVAQHGCAAGFLGFRRARHEGLAGRALTSGRPQLTNDYAGEGLAPVTTATLGDVRSALAVPMRWSGRLQGALSVGFATDRWVTKSDLELLEAFADLACVACRNADEHAEARRQANYDALTGCLNHAAFQRRVREQLSANERSGGELTLVLLDLDDFKEVNEAHGHLAGDSVLRAVGAGIRDAVREHDVVARYGGDEFALILLETPEDQANRVVERTLAAIRAAPVPGSPRGVGACAGIAAWSPGEGATDLIERADRAMRDAKRDQKPLRLSIRPLPVEKSAPSYRADRRRARHLQFANGLIGKLSRLLDSASILETTVEEVHRELTIDRCAIVGLASGGMLEAWAGAGSEALPFRPEDFELPQTAGVVGACLRERRVVLVADGQRDAVGAPEGPRSELAVPLYVGSELKGALVLQDLEPHRLLADDARLAQAVADQVGAVLYSTELYNRLEAVSLGTAEALASALAAKDGYTADHAGSVAGLCVEVGEALGLDPAALRDLRYGALFHDIGKIAVPDAVLNKAGPLSEADREILKRHPMAGEQILASVPMLSGVRQIVRHDHERVDGTGYPDGLRGEQIPIGARIVLVCDAYHAMTSTRPYREAMSHEEAIEELVRNAGSQFDRQVVDALVEVLARPRDGSREETLALPYLTSTRLSAS